MCNRFLSMYKIQRGFIKDLSNAQLLADHQQHPITFTYERLTDDPRVIRRGQFLFEPKVHLIGDSVETEILKEIRDHVFNKYNSAINGSISSLDSVMSIEMDIAFEIVNAYRDRLKAPDKILHKNIEDLENQFSPKGNMQDA